MFGTHKCWTGALIADDELLEHLEDDANHVNMARIQSRFQRRYKQRNRGENLRSSKFQQLKSAVPR